jgi:multidrug efflux system membrane fusion protein
MSFTTKVIVLFSFILLISGCDSTLEAEEAVAPAPTSVSVAEVISERVTEWDDLSGRLDATESVELRPRVSGYISEVVFTAGAKVTEGDILFKIDPESYRADVDRLEADLSSAESQYSLAKSEYERAAQLKKKDAIAQELVDGRLAQLRSSGSNLKAIEASLAISKLNLEYTNVRAPISGRVSNAYFTKGNYVTSGVSTLTSID